MSRKPRAGGELAGNPEQLVLPLGDAPLPPRKPGMMAEFARGMLWNAKTPEAPEGRTDAENSDG
jgi:hypothetical protein